MTPVEIEAALFYYYRSGGNEYGGNSSNGRAPAAKAATEKLRTAGLIIHDINTGFQTTDGLDHYVRELCAVPLPVAKTMWVTPKDGKNEG